MLYFPLSVFGHSTQFSSAILLLQFVLFIALIFRKISFFNATSLSVSRIFPGTIDLLFASSELVRRFSEPIRFHFHAFRWNCVFLSTRWSIRPIHVHLADWYLWLGDQWITAPRSRLYDVSVSVSRNVHAWWYHEPCGISVMFYQ